jgi:dihydrofolate synthase/folylpolyglutamate synthase
VSALDYVFSLEQFGIKLGLDNIRALCAALGDPQRAFPTLIVAGTNGKGSVTAMVDRALCAAGHRSARYISPHLYRIEERFAVAGAEITPEALEATAARVVETIRSLLARGVLAAPPTFFEATTAIAFEAFRAAGASIAVLEVGLGGRLDATNIAEPLAVGITSIDRDHEQQLGHTLAEIAFEKAGVIKASTPAVIGPLAPEARHAIARVAAERSAPLIDALEGVESRVSGSTEALRLELATPARRYPSLALALRGRHQVTNAIVAVRLLETIEAAGIAVGSRAIAQGLETVRWPGRLEWIHVEGGRLLLDAAHNPSGAQTLATYLAELDERMPLVFGALADKDVHGMLAVLLPRVSRVIVTEPPTPRAQPAGEIANQIRSIAPAMAVTIERNPTAAALAALADNGRATVAGSIFLIGGVRGRLAK